MAAGCASAGSTIKSAVGNLPGASATSAPATRTPSVSQPAASVPAAAAAPTAPATPTVRAAGPSSTPAAGTGSGTSLVWLWILLGALLVAAVIPWMMRLARRDSATAADWRSRLVDAYAKGSALYDAMSVAETPGVLATDDAGTRWSDIQRRADDLAQTLYALREAARHPGDKARITDTLASLQAVRSAMDAERAPGGAGPRQAAVVRGRLHAFESSLRALRADNQRYP